MRKGCHLIMLSKEHQELSPETLLEKIDAPRIPRHLLKVQLLLKLLFLHLVVGLFLSLQVPHHRLVFPALDLLERSGEQTNGTHDLPFQDPVETLWQTHANDCKCKKVPLRPPKLSLR